MPGTPLADGLVVGVNDKLTGSGTIVGDVVAELGASSPKEMGKVMAIVMPRVQGRADGRRVSDAVKELLTP